MEKEIERKRELVLTDALAALKVIADTAHSLEQAQQIATAALFRAQHISATGQIPTREESLSTLSLFLQQKLHTV